MPPRSIEQRAEHRVERAFSPPPDVFALKQDDKARIALNRRIRIASTSLFPNRRELLERKLFNELANSVQIEFKKLFTAMLDKGYMDRLVDNALQTATGLYLKTETDKQNKKRLREYLRNTSNDDNFTRDIIEQAAGEATIDFENTLDVYEGGIALYA